MTSIKFYLDEDINVRLAVALRNKGFDAISTPEAKRLKTQDPQQLDYATQNERVIVTCNISDYAKLHNEYQDLKKKHYGIIVTAQQISIGEMLHRLTNLTYKLSAEDMINRLEYLGNWK